MQNPSYPASMIDSPTLVPLASIGIIKASGAQTAKFLQGQLTCDVSAVNAQQSCLGAYCNVKGRILAVFRLLAWGPDFYLLMPRSVVPNTINTLAKYAAFSKVTVADASEELTLFGCAGNTIDTLLTQATANVPSQKGAVIASNDYLIINVSTEMPRFVVMGKADALAHLQQQLTPKLTVANAATWELLDIAAGIPHIYETTQELFTPHMLNLDLLHAVNLNKGCYLGQEIIARTHYLGKSKRRMFKINFTASHSIAPGSVIVDANGQSVGNLVMAAATTAADYIGLAVLPEDLVASDQFSLLWEQAAVVIKNISELLY